MYHILFYFINIFPALNTCYFQIILVESESEMVKIINGTDEGYVTPEVIKITSRTEEGYVTLEIIKIITRTEEGYVTP